MRFHASFLYLLLINAAYVSTCPYAILDWERKSAEERAAQSPIVAVGYVVNSYKSAADVSTTKYSVDFKIVRTIKGEDIVRGLPQVNQTNSSIYRISNFGSMLFCLADLNMDNVFMLFLQVIDNRLSAHYKDYFGAAEIWTMETEESVIKSILGYDSWSEWTACSEKCGEQGIQQRTRACMRSSPGDCRGYNTEKRPCNNIKCQGVRDLIQLADFRSMTKGVISVNMAIQVYYDITPNFYGQISLPAIFSPMWPNEFTIMARVRPRKTKYPREGQYLFSISDVSGRQYLGLKVFPKPTLEMLHSNNQQSVISIPLPHENINDGQWHLFAFSVKDNNITMFYNCEKRVSQLVTSKPFITNVYKSTMIIGSRMYAMDRGANERYEGAISQLSITSDPSDAAKQCESASWGETVQVKAGSNPRQSYMQADGTSNNYLDHWEWSSWSDCSVSCGFGVKVRTPYCLDDQLDLDDCIPYYVPKTHEKQCFAQRCPVCECENNGACVADGVCRCKPGWRGDRCETAICNEGCLNGECKGPNKCVCSLGWTGPSCDKASCFPTCQNGGTCAGGNQCKCAPGFGGRLCTELESDTSLELPLALVECKRRCMNGGRCVNNKCECINGWRGSRCQKPAAVCSKGCANGGKCVRRNICRCKTGFGGRNCETAEDVDVCGGCRNGGLCSKQQKQCQCTSGFTGQLCQYEINDSLCSKAPCQNVGRCIGHDQCYCPVGWFGSKCEYKQCKKYKIKLSKEIVKTKVLQHKQPDCSAENNGNCRNQSGFIYEDREVYKASPDYSECDTDTT